MIPNIYFYTACSVCYRWSSGIQAIAFRVCGCSVRLLKGSDHVLQSAQHKPMWSASNNGEVLEPATDPSGADVPPGRPGYSRTTRPNPLRARGNRTVLRPGVIRYKTSWAAPTTTQIPTTEDLSCRARINPVSTTQSVRLLSMTRLCLRLIDT